MIKLAHALVRAYQRSQLTIRAFWHTGWEPLAELSPSDNHALFKQVGLCPEEPDGKWGILQCSGKRIDRILVIPQNADSGVELRFDPVKGLTGVKPLFWLKKHDIPLLQEILLCNHGTNATDRYLAIGTWSIFRKQRLTVELHQKILRKAVPPYRCQERSFMGGMIVNKQFEDPIEMLLALFPLAIRADTVILQ